MGQLKSRTARAQRYDGWTAERRLQFLGCLAAGRDVRFACARAGLSPQGAYRLQRRDAAFARAWDESQRAARAEAERVFLALLPERLLRTMSTMYGECELGSAGPAGQDPVNSVAQV